MSGGATTLLTAASALIAVLLLFGGGARVVRARGWVGSAQPGSALAVRESLALDAKRRLHLVQCGERRVVLLTGGTQDIVVGWIEDQP